jgi:hypothetical protein
MSTEQQLLIRDDDDNNDGIKDDNNSLPPYDDLLAMKAFDACCLGKRLDEFSIIPTKLKSISNSKKSTTNHQNGHKNKTTEEERGTWDDSELQSALEQGLKQEKIKRQKISPSTSNNNHSSTIPVPPTMPYGIHNSPELDTLLQTYFEAGYRLGQYHAASIGNVTTL